MKRLLSLATVAERTGLSIPAIRRKQYHKQFPFTKVGGSVFVEEGELEKFLTLSRKITATQALAWRSRNAESPELPTPGFRKHT